MRIALLFGVTLLQAVAWRDPSPHEVRRVSVEEGVQLEVLDWGGSGRAVVLLTGSGNTAHVYDEFARKLADCCHVFAITRRGFGHSSHPETGYGDQRLADDVLAVLDALRIEAPVLVGHSMAGSELTTVGRQHSSRIAGLVYLDAGADPKDFPWSDPRYRGAVEKMGSLKPPPPSALAAKRKASYAAYREWQKQAGGIVFGEAEVRNMYEFMPDGSIGAYRTAQSIRDAIDAGSVKRDYTGIAVPVLSIFAMPKPPEDRWRDETAEYRAAAETEHTILLAFLARYRNSLLDAVPGARVLEWPGANHYVYLSNEADTLKELRAFIAALGG
ncbi:MAG: alpha/beta hydrolase [Bryobacteraceae bacterium]